MLFLCMLMAVVPYIDTQSDSDDEKLLKATQIIEPVSHEQISTDNHGREIPPLHSQHIDIGDGEEIVKAYREYDSEEQRNDNVAEESSSSSHTQEKHPFTVETFPLDEKYLVLSDKWEPTSNH